MGVFGAYRASGSRSCAQRSVPELGVGHGVLSSPAKPLHDPAREIALRSTGSSQIGVDEPPVRPEDEPSLAALLSEPAARAPGVAPSYKKLVRCLEHGRCLYATQQPARL